MEWMENPILLGLVIVLAVAVVVIVFLMIRNTARAVEGEEQERVGTEIRDWYPEVERQPLKGEHRKQDGAYAKPGTPLDEIPAAYDETSNIPDEPTAERDQPSDRKDRRPADHD